MVMLMVNAVVCVICKNQTEFIEVNTNVRVNVLSPRSPEARCPTRAREGRVVRWLICTHLFDAQP